MSIINVKLESFEGPFDLLFHLIEKNKIDIYDIPIAELTDQYMEYIYSFDKGDMESISEFILMSATLIEIKSKMLLPSLKTEDNEEDPRDELVLRLIEYKKYKRISEILNEKQSIAGKEYFKNPDKSLFEIIKEKRNKNIDDILNGADIEMLFKAFEDVLKRQEIKTDKVRSKFNSVPKDLFTIKDKIQYIEDLLKINNEISFNKIFRKNSPKTEKIVTFLALLELIKLKKIHIKQKYIFDEIIISSYIE